MNTFKTIYRLGKHLLFFKASIRFYFNKRELTQLLQSIKESEIKHMAELKIVIEHSLDFISVLQGRTSRQRAIEIFSLYRIWDTEENNGVLIYLLLADNKLEIVADRGINNKLGEAYWNKIMENTLKYFKDKKYTSGVEYVIFEITKEMSQLYPLSAMNENKNELSDELVIL